ncbi:Mammalian cell entry related domain protein [Mycobacterium sp. CVI_P3]|uniref:Mammalian cell entry related domain protein n=1 Tax=Mycobacterium pinniadriaticum TaxID=2994102 RepID=A0ABT3SC63_9MYCO|nr:Mammalian cell entry related domain protein [Mycobacterium pinniadriaticum]MCX2930688.1 Mammalian cell entry related domain protein [Mycobacterium pinniadriaticum]MCX2937112.1 Mammalian cell entry related domain protein [Mycobacterium pinniadriaticum]
MLFHKSSESSEARILTLIGMAVITVVAMVSTLIITDPFHRRPADLINVTIESPYVGEGVQQGTELMIHGFKVGEVTKVTSMPRGGVRLDADLQRGPINGLTDTMSIDFRPANYFGVTGINIRPGEGGVPLTPGSVITAVPAGNFTLQALLSRLGEISHGVLTPELIDVIDRTTRYVDGLDPMLETMLVVTSSLANVQNVSTETLMANATGISVAFPGFVDAATKTGDLYLHGGLDGVSEDYWRNTYSPSINLAATDLFGAAGGLVGSHSEELAPLTNMIKVLADVAPGVIPSDEIASTAVELRTRLQRLFAGPPDRRAVNVRVILDSFPGVAAPIDAIGAAPASPDPGADASPQAAPGDQQIPDSAAGQPQEGGSR